MMRSFPLILAGATLALLPMVLPMGVHAHGDFDDALAEFHKHIDDYRADARRLIDEAETVAATYRDGGDAAALIQPLIDSWEEVGIHGAIETRATVIYPNVWQGILGLKQAVENDAGVEAVEGAADTLAGALWQGLGAVRLAASQVGQDEPASAPPSPPEGDSAEQIAHIQAELEQAVEAYAEGDLKRAEALVHDAYLQRFEFLEGELIAQDAALVEDLELDFNARLPQLMQQGAEVEAVREKLDEMRADLDRAGELLAAAEAERGEVF